MNRKFDNPAALSALARGDIENAIIASTPGGVEAQEKAGQTMLVASTNMPKNLSPNREAFEKVGFVFGEEVDAIFMSAKLPPGWKRAATVHDMHSDVVDEKGRRRVSVFYKAAFYDRRADAHLINRFTIATIYSDEIEDGRPKNDCVAISVKDGAGIIWTSDDIQDSAWASRNEAVAQASAWLTERYPNWQDPTAYWD